MGNNAKEFINQEIFLNLANMSNSRQKSMKKIKNIYDAIKNQGNKYMLCPLQFIVGFKLYVYEIDTKAFLRAFRIVTCYIP